MTTLARITGWSRDYILWRLPYAAGLGMIHAELIHQGEVVRYVAPRAGRAPTGRHKMLEDYRAAREAWEAGKAV